MLKVQMLKKKKAFCNMTFKFCFLVNLEKINFANAY